MSQGWLTRLEAKTRTISFTSGKGGVGKSTLISNVAVQLAGKGYRVLILDGDLGMANVDIMFRVKSKYSVYDVISGSKELKDVVVDIDENISLIPGGSGIFDLCQTTAYQKQMLLAQVGEMEKAYDYMLIDTAPGIDENVLYLNSAAQEINVIVTPDPSSLTDAYALIKVLNQRKREERFSIICNQVKNDSEGYGIYKRLLEVTSQFLYVSLEYRGSVPSDPLLKQATRSNQVISLTNRRAPSTVAFRDIAEKLSGFDHINEAKGGLQFFWNQFVGVA